MVELTAWGARLPERQRLRVELFYSPADPYAVYLTFLRVGDDEDDVLWVVARDLLRDGLRGPAGLGDIQVWPAEDGVHVTIGLSSDETPEPCLIELSWSLLARFLRHTTDLVSYGAEDMTDAVDDCLAALFGGDE